MDWRDVEVEPGGIGHTLPMSSWLALFRETGFEVLDLIVIQAPEDPRGESAFSPTDRGRKSPYELVC